jgi:mRNA interferase MazF
MARPAPAEIWLVDLGMAAKVRPCLILSDYPAPDELALMVVVPHTTALRGNRWEFAIPKSFLQSGAFHLQQVQPVSLPRLEQKLGMLTAAEFERLAKALAVLLHLTHGEPA